MTYRTEFCRQTGVVLLEETETAVHIGYWNSPDPRILKCLEMVHGKPVVPRQIRQDSPEARIALHPEAPDHLSDELLDDLFSQERTHNLTPIEEYLRTLLSHTVETGGTDISLWRWDRNHWNIGVRTGGAMRHLGVLDRPFAERLVRHLLHRANLDILDPLSPQDGIVTFPWLPGYRIRLAVVGDSDGRYLALRILDRTVGDLTALGYPDPLVERLLLAASYREGLVLFVGPTGSGKTTGMAALLSRLSTGNRKIVSLEDPVEYRIPGVVQIGRENGALDADLIAAALRQDPDILAFGEIRRRVHAEQLEEAILSGHLVISCLHAGDKQGTYDRLITLGMAPHIVRRYSRAICLQNLSGDPLTLDARIEVDPWL